MRISSLKPAIGAATAAAIFALTLGFSQAMAATHGGKGHGSLGRGSAATTSAASLNPDDAQGAGNPFRAETNRASNSR